MPFNLISEFKPTGDQPEAISQLVQGITDERRYQVLLGVTGSGKTFTIANVIQQVERPTLVLSHNKTLAAQLYKEFKAFFPDNAVEYFVSYYDYYQPEAYLPTTDTYIEKELEINEEIDKLRLRTTASLLSGRRDVIVVSSVSCLYGMADPRAFGSNIIHLKTGMTINRNTLLRRLVDALYNNNEIEFKRGCFRAKGETVDIFPAIETFEGVAYRIEFWDDTIDRITSFDPATSKTSGRLDTLDIYPANLFVTDKETIARAIEEIKEDLEVIAPSTSFVPDPDPVSIPEVEEEPTGYVRPPEACSDFAMPGYNLSGVQNGWIRPLGGTYYYYPFSDKNCENPTGVYNPDNGIITDINNNAQKIGTDAEHIGYTTIQNGALPQLSMCG